MLGSISVGQTRTHLALVPDVRRVIKREDQLLLSYARENLARLRVPGACVAIDECGTGYSSLAYLGNMPVDELKIDRSCVCNTATGVRAQTIVHAVIDFGNDPGLTVSWVSSPRLPVAHGRLQLTAAGRTHRIGERVGRAPSGRRLRHDEEWPEAVGTEVCKSFVVATEQALREEGRVHRKWPAAAPVCRKP